MLRKFLYTGILISLVLVTNQVRADSTSSGSTPVGSVTVASTMTSGAVEVRVMASQADASVTSVNMTLSSVEIYLATGWTKMAMAQSNKVDLVQAVGTERTVASMKNLNPGTYNQVRLNISGLDVTPAGGKPVKAALTLNSISFTKNYQVSINNTTVIVINFDPVKSIDTSVKDHIAFTPVASLLVAPAGALQIINFNLVQGKVGQAYHAQLVAIGGLQPYTWTITMGDMPDGLALDPATGVISGTPSKDGIFFFTVRADDSSPVRKSTARATAGGVVNAGEPGVTIRISP